VTPALDIIIVNFNTRADVLACLDSLRACPPSGRHEIIVADNASSDGSADAIRSHAPQVRVIALSRNAGFGAANNIAFHESSSPLVLFLNSDTRAKAGAIDGLIERLTDTGAVAAGPRLVDADGRPEVSYGSMLSPATEMVQLVRQRAARSSSAAARRYVVRLMSREREVDWVSGACLLVRRQSAEAAGVFDERFFLYEEDVDLCASLRRRGGRILYTPHAEIVHLRGRSRSSAPGLAHAAYDRSHIAFYAKHAPGWVPWLRLWLKLRGRGTMPDELRGGGDPAP
jgi:GT2 family glycosyltransferase